MKTKLSLIIVNTLIIVISVSQSNASIIDQQQPGPRSYGFWFEKDIVRWQEFTPTMPTLGAIEFSVSRWGDPGDVSVEICDSMDNTLYSTIVPEASITRRNPYQCGNDWIWVDIPEISLTVDDPYRIKITALNESTSVDNRYFWNGVTGSDYTQGISCVENSWPDYDFCFKTHAIPEPMTISLLTLGGILLAKKRCRL